MYRKINYIVKKAKQNEINSKEGIKIRRKGERKSL